MNILGKRREQSLFKQLVRYYQNFNCLSVAMVLYFVLHVDVWMFSGGAIWYAEEFVLHVMEDLGLLEDCQVDLTKFGILSCILKRLNVIILH